MVAALSWKCFPARADIAFRGPQRFAALRCLTVIQSGLLGFSRVSETARRGHCDLGRVGKIGGCLFYARLNFISLKHAHVTPPDRRLLQAPLGWP